MYYVAAYPTSETDSDAETTSEVRVQVHQNWLKPRLTNLLLWLSSQCHETILYPSLSLFMHNIEQHGTRYLYSAAGTVAYFRS